MLTDPRITCLHLSDIEEISLTTLIRFLNENPTELGWRGKNKPNPASLDGQILIAEKFINGLRKVIVPSSPTTIPDEMVSKIMELHFGHDKSELERIKKEHQHSMSAENIVGELLEKYIDSVASKFGWVHCVESLVKKIDFIKCIDGEWQLLQVKNRDNSENSSSSAIRDGTKIKKWFRSYSRTGKKNWQNFPDDEINKLLSEEGFEMFVENYLCGLGI